MKRCWYCGHEEAGIYCRTCGKNQLRPRTRLSLPSPTDNSAADDSARRARPPLDQLEAAPIGLLRSSLRGIGDGVVTPRACEILLPSDESMVWEESPSLWVLASLIAKYCGALLLAGPVLDAPAPVLVLIAVAAAIHIACRYCELRTTVYRLSSQRLEITSGFWLRETVTYEVHKLGDASIASPPLLRSAGRSNLVIQTPGITLWGIRSASTVRDLLREAGQIEAGRVDRLRWR